MDFESFFHGTDQRVNLYEKENLVLSGRRAQIDCLSGNIWVTWPDGNEKAMKEGQTLSVRSRGRICVFAFSKSSVRIQKPGWTNLMFPIMDGGGKACGGIFISY